MKVLHGIRTYLPATQNWISDLMRNAGGVEHCMAPLAFLKRGFYEPHFLYLHPLSGFISLPRAGKPGLSWLALGRIAGLFRPLFRRLLVTIASREGIDILHAHFAPNGWRYRKIAGELGVPLIVSFYGYDYEHIPFVEPIWKKRYQTLFREADLFLCEGRFGAEVLAQSGCPARKIRVARLGVDLRKTPFLRRAKRHGELNLLQVASLLEKKGHVYTVRAFIEALERCPTMTLTLVGPNPGILGRDKTWIKRELMKLIREHRVHDRITIMEAVPFARLNELMARHHVFIHPSCYSSTRDCEGGAPVVLLNAQATGMPVISTTHCDIPDVVVDGRTGRLSPEKDVPGLATSIEAFYGMHQDEYDRYCREARAHVERHYDVRDSGEALMRIYHETYHAAEPGETNGEIRGAAYTELEM